MSLTVVTTDSTGKITKRRVEYQTQLVTVDAPSPENSNPSGLAWGLHTICTTVHTA
jgi:hypothetical protein